MKQRRNAVLWALGWWLVRRQVRRRAAGAFADVGASAAAQRGRLRAVLGAVLLVGVLAVAFVAARKLLGGDEPEPSDALPAADAPTAWDAPAEPDAPPEPLPGTAPA